LLQKRKVSAQLLAKSTSQMQSQNAVSPQGFTMSTTTERKRPKSNSFDLEPTAKKPRLESESNETEINVATNEVSNQKESLASSDLYLDTVNRQMLDFDFEKLCSVSLSNLNVYACLVCGKYFQGW
jgi:hypothetical protein